MTMHKQAERTMNNRHIVVVCPTCIHDYSYGLPQPTSSHTLSSLWAEANKVQDCGVTHNARDFVHTKIIVRPPTPM